MVNNDLNSNNEINNGQRFDQNFRESMQVYIDKRLKEIQDAATSYKPDDVKTNYELPSEEFLNLVEYIEYLAQQREEHFSFATDLRFKDGQASQEKFEEDLNKLIDIFKTPESFLANINDSNFLYWSKYIIEKELEAIGIYLKHQDIWGKNPEFTTHRVLRNRLYDVIRGDGTRISDLMNSTGFTVTITPYHENLDIACNRIILALKAIEPELKKRGFVLDSKVFYILSEGPQHEKSHQEAYINYKQEESESRRRLLREGQSRLSEWVNYSVDLEIRRHGNTIYAGMVAGIPLLGSLDEVIHVYLAPKNPSLGDVLLTSAEIFGNGNLSSRLYREVLKELTEICEELKMFPDEKQLPSFLVRNMTSDRNREDFIKNVLIRNFSYIGDAVTKHLVTVINKYREI